MTERPRAPRPKTATVVPGSTYKKSIKKVDISLLACMAIRYGTSNFLSFGSFLGEIFRK
jgi:hypothetical protein